MRQKAQGSDIRLLLGFVLAPALVPVASILCAWRFVRHYVGAGAAVGVIAAGLCFYLLSVWRNPGALARKLEAATSTTFVGDAKP